MTRHDGAASGRKPRAGRVRAPATWIVVGLAGAAAIGCGPSLSGGVTTPEWQAGGQAKCKIAASKAEPLVVEWPSADRAKLEALTKEGLVAVKYNGCEMQVLGACRAKGRYRYVGTTLKRDAEHIKDADQLYAKLPFGAARLEATLQQSGQLDVSMSIVGRYAAEQMVAHEGDLEGSCSGATHVLSALTVGAFEFSAKGARSAEGRASVFDVKAGGSTEGEKQILTKDGDEARCATARDVDTAPPEGCRALLRVEVSPIVEVEQRGKSALLEQQRDLEARRESAASQRMAGWITGGVGLGAGIAAGVLGARASSKVSAIHSGGFATADDIVAARTSAQTFATSAWVAGAVGVAAIGAGVTLVLVGKEPSGPSIGVGLSPSAATLHGAW